MASVTFVSSRADAMPRDAAREERAPLLGDDPEAATPSRGGTEKGPGASSSRVAALAPVITTALWFYANIANNVALQVFRDDMGFANARETAPGRLETAAALTGAQLLLGFVIGMVIKVVFVCGRSFGEIMRETTAIGVAVGALHAAGSTFANVGFLFASAAFVQIIKLIEPFEMLFFEVVMKCYMKKPTHVSVGVLLAVVTVVGSALYLALLKPIDGKKFFAIFYTILSGVCITYRIVVQKTIRADRLKQGSFADTLDEYLNMTFYGTLTLVVYGLGSWAVEQADFVNVSRMIDSFRVQLVVYHPLYYFFSLATLTFVAPITHALLNVCKRIVAVIVTMIVFKETVDSRISVGLVGAFIGGVWYALEKSAAANPNAKWWHVGLLRCYTPPSEL